MGSSSSHAPPFTAARRGTKYRNFGFFIPLVREQRLSAVPFFLGSRFPPLRIHAAQRHAWRIKLTDSAADHSARIFNRSPANYGKCRKAILAWFLPGNSWPKRRPPFIARPASQSRNSPEPLKQCQIISAKSRELCGPGVLRFDPRLCFGRKPSL